MGFLFWAWCCGLFDEEASVPSLEIVPPSRREQSVLPRLGKTGW